MNYEHHIPRQYFLLTVKCNSGTCTKFSLDEDSMVNYILPTTLYDLRSTNIIGWDIKEYFGIHPMYYDTNILNRQFVRIVKESNAIQQI
jgi:hypothetical protein